MAMSLGISWPVLNLMTIAEPLCADGGRTVWPWLLALI